jgi:hypothetical protein
MANQHGAGKARSDRDKNRAAAMKRDGVERTTGRCAVCYATITIDSSKSRYTHVCQGGRIRY